jgi:hypothetical protein
VFFVCYVGNGLSDELIAPSEETYPVCVCNCVITYTFSERRVMLDYKMADVRLG